MSFMPLFLHLLVIFFWVRFKQALGLWVLPSSKYFWESRNNFMCIHTLNVNIYGGESLRLVKFIKESFWCWQHSLPPFVCQCFTPPTKNFCWRVFSCPSILFYLTKDGGLITDFDMKLQLMYTCGSSKELSIQEMSTTN